MAEEQKHEVIYIKDGKFSFDMNGTKIVTAKKGEVEFLNAKEMKMICDAGWARLKPKSKKTKEDNTQDDSDSFLNK